MGIKGFQAHHVLPQYLGKMLGYTTKQMGDHPATLISQWMHTGAGNASAMHKAISNYLPYEKGVTYTAQEIRLGLKSAYEDIGRPELFRSIENLIK